ncbi:MAG: glycosyltransferase, partial [Bacteroidetes bacterium]|nr:glycosyltransferase [Bacteroidota bacterium]
MHSDEKVKIIVIAPFWGKSDHIGHYRVERIVRWLSHEKYEIILIWSGWKDKLLKKDKWTELEIRDPLRRFTRKVDKLKYNGMREEQITRRITFRSITQKIVFYFDRELIWSFWITRKAAVKNICKNSKFIISSSPPESTHLASYILAVKYNLKLIVDMRDGWLDEPMRTYGGRWSIKRNIEKRWEYKILTKASRIFVTSKIWADMLKQRIPMTDNKITILTNAYPIDFNIPDFQPNREKLSNISLLHAGRFLGTRCTNRMSILLEPLYDILKSKNDLVAEIILLGDLLKNDFEEFKYWKQQFINT